MSASDYAGRRFDVLAFRGAESRGDSNLDQSLFGADVGGEVCTGTQKLAQRWALEFLTEQGSMGFHLADRGSQFMTWARSGLLRTEYDVTAYFGFAAEQVRTQLLAEEDDTMPDEERFASVSLDQIGLAQGQLELSVTLTSRAVASRQVILPISITPVNLSL